MWQDFNFICRQTDRRQTDGQTRLLNSALRMHAWGNHVEAYNISSKVLHTDWGTIIVSYHGDNIFLGIS